MKKIKVKGKIFRITKATKQDKQLMAISPEGEKIFFGDPNMREYPGTKRGNSYCARSHGIGNINNPMSANFWSRYYLWNCKGKKSLKRRPTLK